MSEKSPKQLVLIDGSGYIFRAFFALPPMTRPDGPIYGLSDAHGGRLVVFPGGIPLVRNGSIVGAIGVSTGTIEQDQQVAEAGVAAF